MANRIYFIFTFFLFTVFTFIETSYYYIFEVNISPSAIYIFFESNNGEAEEFLSFYFDKVLIVYGIFLFALFVVACFLKNMRPMYVNKSRLGGYKLLLVFVLLALLLKISPLRHQNLPNLLLKSFYVVYFESKVLENDPYKSEKGIFQDAKITDNSKDKLHVVIIGESTTRLNMGLYGYTRQTTPLLENRNDLEVFDNVISPHAGTTASISKALSLDNYEKSASKQGSIIQLLNAAGYKTYWISNQQPVGWAEIDITKVVYGSSKKYFLSMVSSEETRSYDDVVFDKIDEIIQESGNKVLFVHLQGTHIYYKNRYPESYDKFKGRIENNIIEKEADFATINEYDNAVLYNDFIVNTIIDKIEKLKKESFVLYFSDHGEEVYQTKKFVGHNDDVGTLPMYEIPFILWQSESYKRENDNEIKQNRPYMTDDLFHSVADLCDIQSKYIDSTRSIFNQSFKERKRIIKGNQDYDKLKHSFK